MPAHAFVRCRNDYNGWKEDTCGLNGTQRNLGHQLYPGTRMYFHYLSCRATLFKEKGNENVLTVAAVIFQHCFPLLVSCMFMFQGVLARTIMAYFVVHTPVPDSCVCVSQEF